ncbi:hypothetical protein QE152_g9814 [Popillia japonica]|uniref:Uncharacterized protein n=1 Tax=Popillia japonica TaxID=7064 RepID=A0AAW1LTP7_POPJA
MNCLYRWQYYFFLSYNIIKLAEAHIPYKTIALEDFDVCSEVTRRGINFDSTYALNLTQSRLSYHSIQWATSVNCNFRLKTERGRASNKICGNKNANHIMNLQPNSFDSQATDVTFISDIGHSLDIFVYIAKKALKPDETTKINIIFTIYNLCIDSPSDYKPCLETREICIHESYFADGILNCPFFGCVDEGGCDELITTSNSVGKKVLIGSATTLVFIFMVFIVCLYICRKQRKLCWSDNFASPNTTIQTQTARVMEMNDSLTHSPHTSTVAQPADQEDKDLPPSYENTYRYYLSDIFKTYGH